MTVEELRKILEKCNDEDIVKLEISKYSNKKEDFIDTTYEDIYKIYYVHYSDSGETGLVLGTTLYKE